RLPLRCAHDQSVELRAHLDLAGQARILPHVVAEIEHVLFHRRWLAHDRAPSLVDVHVAGCAGTGATTFRLDAGDAVLDRSFHDGRPDLALDGADRTGKIDIGDLGHRDERCGGVGALRAAPYVGS